MKTGREHAALVPAARALLKGQPEAGFIFPGGRGKPHLSTGAMDALLERMGFEQCAVHSFRSTCKDWAAETMTFPNFVNEAALAHTIGDKGQRGVSARGASEEAEGANGGLGKILRLLGRWLCEIIGVRFGTA